MLNRAVDQLVQHIEDAFPGLGNSRWVALRLLEGDASLIEAVRTGELANLVPASTARTVAQREYAEGTDT
jgi:ferrous iron transport protein B